MYIITYYQACRECLQAEDIRYSFSIWDGEPEEIHSKTEFFVVKLLEKWKAEDGNLCVFCGSPNLEYVDVEVAGKKLYEFERISARCGIGGDYLFMVNIDKRDGQSRLKTGGSQYVTTSFVKQVLAKLDNLLDERPKDVFASKEKGNLFACLTGKRQGEDYVEFQVERFRNTGISRKEINTLIDVVRNNKG